MTTPRTYDYTKRLNDALTALQTVQYSNGAVTNNGISGMYSIVARYPVGTTGVSTTTANSTTSITASAITSTAPQSAKIVAAELAKLAIAGSAAGSQNPLPSMADVIVTARSIAQKVLFAQLGQIYGTGSPKTLSAAQEFRFTDMWTKVMAKVDAAFPFVDSTTGSRIEYNNATNTAWQTLDGKLSALLTDGTTGILNDTFTRNNSTTQYSTYAEFKDTANMPLLIVALLTPYARFKYLASFVAGEPNMRPDASFYDSRMAQWLVWTELLGVATQLKTNLNLPAAPSAGTDAAAALTNATTATSQLTSALQTREATDETVNDMFKLVANASRAARDNSKNLASTSATMEARRTRIGSLQWNVAQAEAGARRARLAMFVWLAAFCVVAAVAVAFLVSSDTRAFTVHANAVIATAVLLLCARGLFAWLHDRQVQGA